MLSVQHCYLLELVSVAAQIELNRTLVAAQIVSCILLVPVVALVAAEVLLAVLLLLESPLERSDGNYEKVSRN